MPRYANDRTFNRARQLFIVAGAAVAFATPLHAQTNTNTTSTSGVTSTPMTDAPRSRADDDNHFPWGLLGLLGLAGLMGRRRVETVQQEAPRTARPGEPNYRT
jgi:MYXO-CTERM domain-containing protein